MKGERFTALKGTRYLLNDHFHQRARRQVGFPSNSFAVSAAFLTPQSSTVVDETTGLKEPASLPVLLISLHRLFLGNIGNIPSV